MPAEWEPHLGTLLAWPHNESHWPGKLQAIPPVYARIIAALAKSEKVFICVNDEKMEAEAYGILQRETGAVSDNAVFCRIATNASWSRDHGPIFVRDEAGKLMVTDWIYNACGEKWPPWDLDDAVPRKFAGFLNLPAVSPGMVLEGGSIDVNGRGTLITTEQCLLNKNRNPHLNRGQIENYLEKYLGATNVIWLKEGIAGDDTDGHVDDIARFVNENTVVCAIEENPQDENYKALKKNFELLTAARDRDGNPFKVISLPMPDPVIYSGERLPASYANFLIANTVVLVPTFRCGKDEKALKILADLFPEREIIGIDCIDLVWGMGTIHCSTQQIPIL